MNSAETSSISIIIPCLNEQATILPLLTLLKKVGKSHSIEIILADSPKSTDQLEKLSKKLNVRYIKTPYYGRSKQMNFGASLAKHDVLYFLHADTIPPITFVSDILTSLKAGNEFGYFSYRFDSKNLFLKLNSFFTRYKSLWTGGGDQSLYIKKDLFIRLNGFNEDFPICEDFEFFRRLNSAKINYEIISSKVLVSARKYRNNRYFKVNAINLYVLILFYLGKNPHELKAIYSKYIK